MKRYIFILLLALSFLGAKSQQVYSNKEVTVSILKDKVWVFETFDKASMYLVAGKDKAVLIDTGQKCKDLDKIVKQLSDLPLEVVITHAHPDHIGCINYFDKVWIHRNDSALIDKFAKDYPGEILYMTEGQVFDLGERKLEVALMPGHTPGSVVLLDKKNGDCYSGDTFGSGQVWLQLLPHVSMKVYYDSCARMEQIMQQTGIERIFCGHYPHLKKALELPYITEMKTLAKRISDGEDVEAVAYPYSNHVDFAAKKTVIARNGSAMIVYDSERINE